MTSAESAILADDRRNRSAWTVTVAVVAFSSFSIAMLQTQVAPAIATIHVELRSPMTSVAWVVTAFLLVASVSTPIVGRLGDMFGKRRMLIVVLVVVAAGCLLAGFSRSLPLLIVARAMQGIGGGIFPLAFAVVRDVVPSDRLVSSLGVISSTFGVGAICGVLSSGLILEHLDYWWIFRIEFVIFAVAASAARVLIPDSPWTSATSIDWLGAILLGALLSSFLLALTFGPDWGWASPGLLGLLVVCVTSALLWLRWESRVLSPLVDLRLFRSRGIWTLNLIGLLSNVGFAVAFVFVPTFVQVSAATDYGFGIDAAGASLFLVPLAVAALIASLSSGWLARRSGSWLQLVGGSFIYTIAFVLLVVAHGSRVEVMVWCALAGLGFGLILPATATLVSATAPHPQIAEANASVSIMRTMGGAVGAQLAAALVAAAVIPGTAIPAERGYVYAFAMAAATALAALAVTAVVPRDHGRVRAA